MRHLPILSIMMASGLFGALAGCGHSSPASDCGRLTIRNAWVTPAHAGSREMLGYFTLHNAGSEPVSVNGVASSAFDRAIFQNKAAAAQSSNNADGGAQPLAPFTVKGGADMAFRPGQREVALYSPTRAYRVGDTVRLSVICGSQHARLATSATVRDRNGDLPAAGDDEDAADRKQVIQDGRDGGGAGATDDSKTAN